MRMLNDRAQLTVILLSCILSATVLTAMKILPSEVMSHMIMTCVGGALMGMVPGFANRLAGATVPAEDPPKEGSSS
jgi:hypothetical protein